MQQSPLNAPTRFRSSPPRFGPPSSRLPGDLVRLLRGGGRAPILSDV
jgi:hypothetical protein